MGSPSTSQELSLFTASYGTGAGRQLVLRRRPFKTTEEDNEGDEDEGDTELVQAPEPYQRLPRNRRWRKARLLQR